MLSILFNITEHETGKELNWASCGRLKEREPLNERLTSFFLLHIRKKTHCMKMWQNCIYSGYSIQDLISWHNLISYSNSFCSPSCYLVNNKITCSKSFSAASAVLKAVLGYWSTQKEKRTPQQTSLKNKSIFLIQRNHHSFLLFFVNWLEKGIMKVSVKKVILLR